MGWTPGPGPTSGDDTYIGDNTDETVSGGDGNDTLNGGGGNDILNGDAGNDTLLLNDWDSHDILNGGDGDDLVRISMFTDSAIASWTIADGGAGNDTLYISGGNFSAATSFTGFETVIIAPFGVNGTGLIITPNFFDNFSTLFVSHNFTLSTTGTLDLSDLNFTASYSVPGQSFEGYVSITGTNGDDTLIAPTLATGALITFIGGFGNDTLVGGAGGERFDGRSGDDVINGGAGSDLITGDVGNDQLTGGDGNDTISAGAGIDHVDAGSGDDVIGLDVGDGAADAVDGGDGVDVLIVDGGALPAGAAISNVEIFEISGHVTVQQGSLDNFTTLWAFGGTLTLVATGTLDLSAADMPGSYTLHGGYSSDVQVSNATFTVMGTSGADTFFFPTALGSAGAIVHAGGGDDVINGGGGNDTLYGEAGSNIINGGGGFDTIYVSGNDTVDAGTTNDLVIISANVVTIHADAGDDEPLDEFQILAAASGAPAVGFTAGSTLVGFESITLVGNNGFITIAPGILPTVGDLRLSGVTIVHGSAGTTDFRSMTIMNDINQPKTVGFEGSSGNDSFLLPFSSAFTLTLAHGNGGDDVIQGATGGSTMFGDAGNDALTGSSGIDNLSGGDGNDTLSGGGGDDLLIGGAGADAFNGGGGTDTVDYSSALSGVHASMTAPAGNTGDAAGDTFTLIESIIGSANGDVLEGDGNANLLTGNDGDDTLLGAGANDQLIGGAGNDTLDGGAGFDVMNGGVGDDIYIVDSTLDAVSDIDGLNDTVRTSVNGYALPTDIENGVITSGAGLTLTGNSGRNMLTGGGGNDTLQGANGNDVLIGGAGADVLSGDSGFDTASYHDDVAGISINLLTGITSGGNAAGDTFSSIERIEGGTGADTLVGDANPNTFAGYDGNDQIDGGDSGDTLLGENGDDSLSGGNGFDSLDGGAGNDILNGGADVDTMAGGAGNDVYYVDNISDVVTENSGEGVDAVLVSISGYTLSANVEVAAIQGSAGLTLSGNVQDNILYGAGGADMLFGGGGDDTLQGGAGADTMTGGLGNDTFYVAQVGDTVNENSGEGFDATIVQLTSAYTLAANVEIGATFLSSGVNITGNGLDNLLYGNAGADTLSGSGGNDTIQGGAGNDTMAGGVGNDTYFVEDAGDVVVENTNEGSDAAIVFTSSYTLAANVEVGARFLTTAFTLTGNTLDNQLYGNAGDDTLNGGDGNDTLQGGAGNDIMVGGLGNDTYFVEQAGDVVTESANQGNDAVIVLIGSYTLATNVEVGATFLTSGVSITGNALGNSLYGNAGADTLSGAAGADFLDGGAGVDTLTGGSENDVFMFVAGQGNGDIVTDFDGAAASTGDQLRFSGYGTLAGGATFVQIDATHWQINSADGTIHDTITLANGASVDSSDWLFV